MKKRKTVTVRLSENDCYSILCLADYVERDANLEDEELRLVKKIKRIIKINFRRPEDYIK